MGLFKKNEPAEPVRRDRVMRLIKLGMDEAAAGDRELSQGDQGNPTPDFDRARRRLGEASATSTPAEVAAAQAALERNGYS